MWDEVALRGEGGRHGRDGPDGPDGDSAGRSRQGVVEWKS